MSDYQYLVLCSSKIPHDRSRRKNNGKSERPDSISSTIRLFQPCTCRFKQTLNCFHDKLITELELKLRDRVSSQRFVQVQAICVMHNRCLKRMYTQSRIHMHYRNSDFKCRFLCAVLTAIEIREYIKLCFSSITIYIMLRQNALQCSVRLLKAPDTHSCVCLKTK